MKDHNDLDSQVNKHMSKLTEDSNDIEKAKEDAEIPNSDESGFFANISREMRSPMSEIASIMNNSMNQATNTDLTEEERIYVNITKRSVDSLQAIINNVVDFSRIEATKLKLEEQHKQLQRQLFESRNKIRIVFDALNEEIVVINENFQIESLNHAFLKITNSTYNDVIGRYLFESENIYPPHSIPAFKNLLINVFKTGVTQYGFHESTDDHGEKRDKQITCLPLRDSAERVFKIAIVSKDITDEKRNSEKIKDLNKKLIKSFAQVKNQNKKLTQTLKMLEESQIKMLESEKMASIGQLAAGIAHEINNPAGFVGSNLNTLMEYQDVINKTLKVYHELMVVIKDEAINSNLPANILIKTKQVMNIEKNVDIEFVQKDISTLVKDCCEGIERIQKIVFDLRVFAHPGKDELIIADINKRLESSLNVVYNELKYKAKVNMNFGKLPQIKCFPQELDQVFINILMNAGQAIETNGEVHIGTKYINGNIEVAIRDNGSGIPEENLSRIFDPFFTTKEVGLGTGLGMHIAYNIIKKHKGTIDVQSVVGKGTTFTIRLPMDENKS